MHLVVCDFLVHCKFNCLGARARQLQPGDGPEDKANYN